MKRFAVRVLDYDEDELVYFDTLQQAVNYHMRETKWLDTPIGIWDDEKMVAIGFMWDVFYLEGVKV